MITAATDAVGSGWDQAIGQMLRRIDQTLALDLDGFPTIADPTTGEWQTSIDGFWTGGFWVGLLWLADRYTGDIRYRRAAEKWLFRLSNRVVSRTVFRGLLFYPSAVVGAEIGQSDPAHDLAIRSGRALGHQFVNELGMIPLGGEAEEAHSVGDYDVNIDGLPASPLMLWAAKATGDGGLREKAMRHATRSAEIFLQSDGSVIQSASLDPATGNVLRRYTHKGISETSIWTRAQAWAMLGFSLSAVQAPGTRQLEEWARQTSEWWVRNVPADKIAYWDFNTPLLPATWRDTSGTAIAAAAMLRLGTILHGDDRTRFSRHAELTVQALVDRHLTPVGKTDQRPPGILADGCFDVRNNNALQNELIWGDYFLFECLGRLAGRLDGVSF